ncbi:MAG: phosphodiesterase [Clostridia bacterium]|nr:phosphodiesterase [Clostridia bacterium]
MKLMIASDLHGDAESTAALLRDFDESLAERLVLLGDLLYHGPRNDLPAGYAPKEVIRLLNERREVLLCVRGNCDTEVDQMVLNFPILSDSAYIVAGRYTLYATHGHRDGEAAPPPLRPGEILLCGHTHVPAARPMACGNLYVNPGSVSIPKEGSPKSYLLLDSEQGTLSFRALGGQEYRRFDLT